MEIRGSEAEAIALAYYRAHGRDGWGALVHALADLAKAKRQSLRRDRLSSRGYVRGCGLA